MSNKNIPKIEKREGPIQRTLVMLKPEAIKRNKYLYIIKDFKKAGLKIVTMKNAEYSKETIKKMREGSPNSEFIEWIAEHLSKGQVLVMILEGENAIKKARSLCGKTDSSQGSKDELRHKYFGNDSLDKADAENRDIDNGIHIADSEEHAKYEAGVLDIDINKVLNE